MRPCDGSSIVTNPTPVILAAAGIQSPLDAQTRCGPEGTLHVERHPDHDACLYLPRHSLRSGNPEPFRCASADMATKIRQVGAQASPASAYKVFQPALNLPDPPSFSPQWESRALSMRRTPDAALNLPGHSAGTLRVTLQVGRRPVHRARLGWDKRLGARPGLWPPVAMKTSGKNEKSSAPYASFSANSTLKTGPDAECGCSTSSPCHRYQTLCVLGALGVETAPRPPMLTLAASQSGEHLPTMTSVWCNLPPSSLKLVDRSLPPEPVKEPKQNLTMPLRQHIA